MTEIYDTELLQQLMEDDAKQTPGVMRIKAMATLKMWDPTTGAPYEVYHCEPSHTVGEGDDTKICCPGCGQLCDMDCCWCGSFREDHQWDTSHGFVPMGCDCQRGTYLDPAYREARVLPLEPEVECEWDIL